MSIIEHIKKYIPIENEEMPLILSLFQNKKYTKKEILLHENTICTQSYFVLSGCLRAYSTNEDGVEHILQFALENWWITDMYSLLSTKPSILNIEAIEDSEVLVLTKENQEILYNQIPKFERYFRILLENSLVASRKRVLDNMQLNAKQKFALFCKTYPNLVNRIPQKQIASFLGMTPEFFSKIKAEYFREH